MSTVKRTEHEPQPARSAPSLGFIKFNMAAQTLFQAGMFCALVAIAAKLYAKGGGNGGIQPPQVSFSIYFGFPLPLSPVASSMVI